MMTFDRFQELRSAAISRGLTSVEVTELFDDMETRDRERRIAIELQSCHYNDGPCSKCAEECDKIDPNWRNSGWSDGIAEDLTP